VSRLVTRPVRFGDWRPEKAIRRRSLLNAPAVKHMRTLPCASCEERAGWTIHHVVPKAQRGDDLLSNLIQLCVDCHDALHHAPDATAIHHRIGQRLTAANIEYVLWKKGAAWLEDRYGVIA